MRPANTKDFAIFSVQCILITFATNVLLVKGRSSTTLAKGQPLTSNPISGQFLMLTINQILSSRSDAVSLCLCIQINKEQRWKVPVLLWFYIETTWSDDENTQRFLSSRCDLFAWIQSPKETTLITLNNSRVPVVFLRKELIFDRSYLFSQYRVSARMLGVGECETRWLETLSCMSASCLYFGLGGCVSYLFFCS